MLLDKLLQKGLNDGNYTPEELKYLLSLEDYNEQQKLYNTALKVKEQNVKRLVHLRGLIEISNVCIKDCLYCGIRRSNKCVDRFSMSEEEILSAAKLAFEYKYGSIVLQGGENKSAKHIDFIEQIILKIKELSNGKLGITLSLGEQSKQTYQRWFNAGAHRYLLRIEASDSNLYEKLHPKDHSYKERLQSLVDLKACGYQVGTGVMMGLPFQNIDHLVADLLFFKKIDVDMLGMGPYIIHHDTPLGKDYPEFGSNAEKQLAIGLKMIAVARLFLRDVNIASTTALQSLASNGRELGILAGANVIMPNIGDLIYRKNYLLYDNKPGTDENIQTARENLENSISSIGEVIDYENWGDSPHALKKHL